MEKSSKRGKIPQHDWPSIIKRYEAGETLASIARTYDCSPPAISYIVSRNRARESTADHTAPGGAESSAPQLVKEGPDERGIAEGSGGGPEIDETRTENMAAEISIPVNGLQTDRQQTEFDNTAQEPHLQKETLMPEVNGAPERGQLDIFSDRNSPPGRAPGESGHGAPRRTLHLSLSQEGARRPEGQDEHSPGGPESSSYGKAPGARSAETLRQGTLQSAHASSTHNALPTNGGSSPSAAEPHRAKDADAFIDQALRERVDGDITAFLSAFDAALADDTPESRAGLRDATDRLLRAGARTRIQLERLEARVPLPPRDRLAGPTWRAR
jgi:hypothetical protein